MKTTSSYLAVALIALSTACSRSGSGAGLSVSARAAAAAATSSADGLALPDGITISRIRIAVQRISVEDPESACTTSGAPASTPMMTADEGSGGSGGGSGEGGDDGACPGELSFGPFDVDLAGSALGGSVAFAFDAPIPAGTYGEVAIRIDTVPASLAGGDPVLEDLAAAHASILVDGLVEDDPSTIRPFTFSTSTEITQKREGAIVVGPGANVTLDLDPSHWFDGPSGRLDPADPAAQEEIVENIRASIRLVGDRDRDGREDDDEGPDPEHATTGHP